MKPASDELIIPPALAAQILAAADDEHRPAAEVVQEALERYLAQRRENVNTTPARRTPAEAAARLLERRKGTLLPDGVTIRDLMTHGRA
jgi:hypothetical protein